MIQAISRVLSSEPLSSVDNTHLLRIHAPEIAALACPGQFVMARCGNSHDPLLRRPLSIHSTVSGAEIALLFQVVGTGTSWLSRRQAGDEIDLMGPLGNGYSFQPGARLLLVAGGIGIAPLAFLSEVAASSGNPVTLLMGARTGTMLYPGSLLPSSVVYIKATEDGSQGIMGKVTDIMGPYLAAAEQVFACGPTDMYRSMASAPILREKPVQISLEEVMGCGVGACYSCTVWTTNGLRQVCHDGPIFNLKDILW